jgi:hypothetical protein
MKELFPVALHKAILGVDIEGFADRRRTNPDQILAREGLYCCLQAAFARTGIAWDLCYREDRGDGALILVPPEIPKSLLVSRFPQELSISLQGHNQSHPAESRIRVRLVVHGGEVHRDEHGVVGTAVNVAFRLLEATGLKHALRSSPGQVALIASDWFYQEVIRHTPASRPDRYRQVRVLVKETDELAWIGLPDSPQVTVADPASRRIPDFPLNRRRDVALADLDLAEQARRWQGRVDQENMGPGHPHPGRRTVHRAHRLDEGGGGRRAERTTGRHLRQRRSYGADMGPGHRRPNRRPVRMHQRPGTLSSHRGSGRLS